MNSRPPESLTKLPLYTAPSLNPIRPPSPLTGNPDDSLNSFVAPAGCELILHNPNKSSDGSTIRLVKKALADISANKADVKDLPLAIVDTGSPAKDANLSYCYVQLHPSTAAPDTSPRPDLLWQWWPHLLKTLEGWDVTWAPQKHWKDKLYWVCVTSPQQIHETDHARFHEEVDGSCRRTGYSINSSFMMKPLSVGIVMAMVADAKHLIEATSITLDCAAPFRQIDIAWAFEIVFGGVSSYDCTFNCYIDKYFASCYSRNGQSLLHSSRVVDEDFYCFIMFDWETTSRVLKDKEEFATTFNGMNLTPPHLIYNVNSNSSFNLWANTALAICAAGQDVLKDLENINRRIEQMAREMHMGFQHAEHSLTIVSKKVGVLTESTL